MESEPREETDPFHTLVHRRNLQSFHRNIDPSKFQTLRVWNFNIYEFRQYSASDISVALKNRSSDDIPVQYALFFGLGGDEKDLQVGTFANFVKEGASYFVIETTLSTGNDRPTTVVARKHAMANNKTSWKINGVRTKAKDLQPIIMSLNIMITQEPCSEEELERRRVRQEIANEKHRLKGLLSNLDRPENERDGKSIFGWLQSRFVLSELLRDLRTLNRQVKQSGGDVSSSTASEE